MRARDRAENDVADLDVQILHTLDAVGGPPAEAVDARLSGHRELHAADHHIALNLRSHQRLAHAPARRLGIDNLARTKAQRRCLTDSENCDAPVGLSFADGRADLAGAHVQTDQ